MKWYAFYPALGALSAAAGATLWLTIGYLLPGYPGFVWQAAGLHALLIFAHGARLKSKVGDTLTDGGFLLRLGVLYAVTAVAMPAAYFAYLTYGPDPGAAVGSAGPAREPTPHGLVRPEGVALWAGILAWCLSRWLLFSASLPPKRPKPDFGTDLRTGREARSLAKQALPPDDPGLSLGGIRVMSALARLGTLLVGSVGAGKTTLLRLILQSAMALPAIRPGRGVHPGSDCRAWVLDVKCDMVPVIQGIVGESCPVYIFLPTDLRSVRWAICEDVKDDATCLQFARLFSPDEPGQNPFWPNAVQTLIYAALIYLTRKTTRWDLRGLVLILEDEALTRQVVNRVRDNRYVRHLFKPKVTWQSIRVTLAVKLTQLRLIAAMWDRCRHEVSLDWWTRNEAVLVFGMDPSIDETLKVLIRIMFRRTAELLLARGPDDTGRRFNWVVLDELPALEHLGGLSELALRGRAGGTCVVAGVQSVADVRNFFKGSAAGLLGQLFNRCFLRTDDPETAQWMEECVGKCEVKEPKETHGASWTAGMFGGEQNKTLNQSWSEERVTRPAFSREDFQNMAPASRKRGIPVVVKSDLGETTTDNHGQVREIVTTWFDTLPGDATFGKLIPADPETPKFLPRPPEHQRLRPFSRSDYARLQLAPPSEYMRRKKHAPCCRAFPGRAARTLAATHVPAATCSRCSSTFCRRFGGTFAHFGSRLCRG